MLEVNFTDINGHDMGSMFGTEELPEGLHSISVDGSLGSEPASFERLTNMLKRHAKRIRFVTLQNIHVISPEFLAALISIAKTTDFVKLVNVFLSDPGYACLMTCMMQPNGIEDLLILHYGDNMPFVTIPQVLMLFEGIAHSPSLKQVDLLRLPLGPHNDEAARALIHTLRRNRSLEHFNLQMGPFTCPHMITNILRAALLETKVEWIEYGYTGDEIGQIDFRTFSDLICREKCSLKRLELSNVTFATFNGKPPPFKVKNASVETLMLMDCYLNSSLAADIAERCKSLTALNVTENQITDLAPFDKLLLGDDAKLESLYIYSNPIEEEHFLVFLKKVPMMKSLRELDIQDLPFLKSKSCRDALLEALWSNTSLENVCCCSDDHWKNIEDNEGDDDDDEDIESFHTMITIPLSLNRGGRRELQSIPTNSLPRGLWARVLHRANTIKYCSASDSYCDPQNTTLRPQVVYWLLRNKVLV